MQEKRTALNFPALDWNSAVKEVYQKANTTLVGYLSARLTQLGYSAEILYEEPPRIFQTITEGWPGYFTYYLQEQNQEIHLCAEKKAIVSNDGHFYLSQILKEEKHT